MADERLEKIKAIFTAAVALQGREREVLLNAACRDDDELRREVESLLHVHCAGEVVRIADSTASIASTEATPLTEKPGMRIGPYKLLQQIGEGGFGGVFMADQEHPIRRRVALKIIKLGMDTRRVVARFEAERQALAMMDHPNIARVLDAGATESGRPYFVMELVKGEPITDYSDRNNLSIPERLELFMQVCNAVQHAHTKGIIHRDIKPSNVLVSTQDGRPHAKVIDFGIAKATDQHLTDKTLFTEHKALIGTPAYMSPEQAEGSLDIDTRTDVYALGVLLYELLTGTTPFDTKQLREAAFAEIHRIIREVEPPKPSTRLSQSADTLPTLAARRRTEPKKLGILVRGELDWIVMKALDKDRARRYETANSLADDVRRHRAGEPIIAAQPSKMYRVRKLVKRHKGPVIATSAVALALLLGIIGVYWKGKETERQRDLAVLAEAEKSHALEKADKANANLTALVAPMQAGLLRLIQEALATFNTVSASSATGEHSAQAFLDSPIGKVIEDSLIPAAHDRMGMLFQATVGSNGLPHLEILKLDALGGRDPQEQLAGVLNLGIASLHWNRKLTQDLHDKLEETERLRTEAVAATERAEFGEYVANIVAADASIKADEWPAARARLADCKPELRNWEWGVLHRQARTCRFALKNQFAPIISPDSARMVTTSVDSTAQMWDMLSGSPIGGPIPRVRSAAFACDGKKLLTLVNHGAQLWDTGTGQAIGSPMWPECELLTATFSPNGSRALLVSKDHGAQLWDAVACKPIGMPMQHEDSITSAIFGPDGTRILTVSADTTAQLWDGMRGVQVGEALRHSDAVTRAIFSPDSARILTIASYNQAQLWNAETGGAIGGPMPFENFKRSPIFSPNGAQLVIPSDNCSLKLVNCATGAAIGATIRHTDPITDTVFSPDGKHILTVSQDKTMRIWDAATGAPTGEPMTHMQLVESASFNSNGTRVLSISGSAAFLWDATSGDAIGEMTGDEYGRGFAAIFSPDGKRIVTYSKGQWIEIGELAIRLWSAAIGEQQDTIILEQSIGSLCFSPDSSVIVTGDLGEPMFGAAAPLHVWDINSACNARSVQTLEIGINEPKVEEFMNSSETRFHYERDGRSITTEGPDARKDGVAYLRGLLEQKLRPALSPDGSLFAAPSGHDTVLPIYDVATGHVKLICRGHLDGINTAVFSWDGRRIATGSKDGSARVFDTTSGEQMTVLLGHTDEILGVAFSPDGSRIITGSKDDTARIWDANSGESLCVLDGHKGDVVSLAFNSNGTRFVTGSLDSTARVWTVCDGRAVGLMQYQNDPVEDVYFQDDQVYSVSHSGAMQRLELPEWWQLIHWILYVGNVRDVSWEDYSLCNLWMKAFLRNPQRFTPVSHDASGMTAYLSIDVGCPTVMAFSPDHPRLAIGTEAGTIRIMSTPDRLVNASRSIEAVKINVIAKELLVLRVFDSQIEYLDFTPDGRRLLAAAGTTLRIWDAGPPEEWSASATNK